MLDYFKQTIERLKSENRYREFLNLSRICGEFPCAIDNNSGRKIVVWCSNDYLGMGQNEEAINEAIKALKTYGLGAGGTRNISGTSSHVVELEKNLATLHHKEAALAFVSGYVANDATIQALSVVIPDLIIFSDAKNHASIITGIRNSRAIKHVFRHNDMAHLEELLSAHEKTQPKLIIFESVYSMDGDFGKVVEIVALAKKYNALTYVDEVHGVGLYGKNGAGLCEALGVADKIDIIQGTLAKAFGAIGGYIAAKKEIIDAVRLVASGFIFTTALPPAIAAALSFNVKHLQHDDSKRKKLHENVALLKAKLQEAQIKIIENESHIIAIRIGDAVKAKEISRRLLDEFNIYVQHINFPTVERGDERLRITVTPFHSEAMIDDLVKALRAVL